MALNLYGTTALAGLVAVTKSPSSFLVDRFFGASVVTNKETVLLDIKSGARSMAAFVSPYVEGRVVQKEGYATKEITPAYIKEKMYFHPSDAVKRMAGEDLGGVMSPQQRLAAQLQAALNGLRERIDRRFAWMAACGIVSGSVVIEGEGYPAVNVDFGRAAAHSVTLSGAAKWTDASAKPLDNITTWGFLISKATGSAVTDVVMGADAWLAFVANPQVSKELDRAASAGQFPMRADLASSGGGVYMGSRAGVNYWVYTDWYIDPDDGDEKPMFPGGGVALIAGGPGGYDGVRYFGLIRDIDALEAGTGGVGGGMINPLPYWPKTWVEHDPSSRVLMLQSAPILAPQRPDASLFATVI